MDRIGAKKIDAPRQTFAKGKNRSEINDNLVSNKLKFGDIRQLEDMVQNTFFLPLD